MGDLVNLRRFRKAKRREDEARKADENRVAFGRSKAEKNLTEAAGALEARRLEGHRRDPAPPAADPDRPDE